MREATMSERVGEWDEYYRAVGAPEEVYSDAKGILSPPPPDAKVAVAQCLRCRGYRRVEFRFFDEEFVLLGHRFDADQWDRIKSMDGRIRAECAGCGRETHWVSRGWKPKGAIL
jgi:hypothetical protein